jgi:uncharacterized protein YjbI with pentapeptide repeats
VAEAVLDWRGRDIDAFDFHTLRDQFLDATLDRPVIEIGDFQGTKFHVPVDFSDVGFGEARFDGATFHADANFAEASFRDVASFESVTFEQAVTFEDATFECPAIFEFEEESEDPGAGRRREVIFGGWADFRRVRFKRGARFGGANFESRARFGAATVGTAKLAADASFDGARFVRARTLGPVLVRGRLSLDRCSFEAPSVRIEVSARSLSCVRTHFAARTTMEVRFAAVSLEDSEFVVPSIVGGSPDPFPRGDTSDSEFGELGWKPRIGSLRRANVGNLTLANVDVTQCCFVGAHNLDRLRFESVDFPHSEPGSTSRWMIAEEMDPSVPRDRVAEAYRSLRKGREDSKDEPGAADFYYGEMEMRRKSAGGFDAVLLPLYWLVSGYGLRAWRSLAALAVTVVLFAWGFQAWGFDPDAGFWKSLLFSAESTTSLFRAPSPPNGADMTDLGLVLQMVLRLLGPLFFGLALLALRGRVKR